MTAQKKVRIALIGAGAMGTPHLKDMDKYEKIDLCAVCDIDRENADKKAAQYKTKAYYDYKTLFSQEKPDAIVIATPHYAHTTIAIDAFKLGIHVLTEKPVGVHAKDVQLSTDAYLEAKKQFPGLLYSAMFQQRTYGFWKKIKELIESGELGKLVRTTWIITDWFRTQSYYDNGGWRATWSGEGGGVLTNQCPHQLDLFTWFVGLPSAVTGFASIGKYHHIEVEDEVTAYLEYENGMVGHFITSTGEAPGTNRLEIVGENGKIVFEDNKLVFYRNRVSMLKQLKDSKEGFNKPENWKIDIPYTHHGEAGHRLIIENFADAILEGKPLIANATEGLASVSLGNAIMYSSFNKSTKISMPIDQDGYAKLLNDLIKNSTFKKEVKKIGNVEMSGSF